MSALLILFGVLLFLWVLLTEARSSVPARGAPLADEVGAGRDAYRRLRWARGNRSGTVVNLDPQHLAGLGALVSHGFRPDRLKLTTVGNELRIDASHYLAAGRWLNVKLRASAPSKNFPVTRISIGHLSLPTLLSRWVLQSGRLMLGPRGADVPGLDQAVRNFSITNGRLRAMISLPDKSGLVDEMAGLVGQSIDGDTVLRIFCGLSEQQRQRPSSEFSEHLRRAFSVEIGGIAPARFNDAAFVALGMFVVDLRVADFAHLSPNAVGRCGKGSVSTMIYGRGDWPKHWALSAAIAVSSGSQLSEAVGEWKELADSLSRQSQFAIGDPSGFSMSDIAADRAGFKAAHLGNKRSDAGSTRSLLAQATDEQLLPRALVEPEESMTNAVFIRRYGGLDDPRFQTRLRQIDATLDRTGIN